MVGCEVKWSGNRITPGAGLRGRQPPVVKSKRFDQTYSCFACRFESSRMMDGTILVIRLILQTMVVDIELATLSTGTGRSLDRIGLVSCR